MATDNKKPEDQNPQSNPNPNPKADKDQSATKANVIASDTPQGKDYRPMQDGDTKVQNPNRNLAEGGNNSDLKDQ